MAKKEQNVELVDEVVLQLDDREKALVEPFVKRLRALEAEQREVYDIIRRLVAMREPRVLERGVTFDLVNFRVVQQAKLPE